MTSPRAALLICGECEFKAKSKVGLSSHFRHKHPDSIPSRVLTWEETLESLGVDPNTPDEELTTYSTDGYYTREGDTVFFHAKITKMDPDQ